MENISIYVVCEKVDRDFLRKVIDSLIYEDDYSAELKLELFEAIM